jgi:hypothetical protein
MRKRFGQALRIGVSPQGLALLKTSRWRGAPLEVMAEHRFDGAGQPGFEAIGAALRQLLQEAGCAGWPATIVLADELARLWQVSPPADSARLADLEAAAALRFQALYGEPAATWQLAAGWDAGKPFLAAAMPRHLLALLQHAAAEQQIALIEIVPQFIAGWNQWCGALKPGAWYGLVQQGVLTLAALDAGCVRAVRAAALPDGASLEWLGQHVAREALRLNLVAPARLQLSGAAPAAWNNSSGAAIACSLLAPGHGAALSGVAQLAATGARP